MNLGALARPMCERWRVWRARSGCYPLLQQPRKDAINACRIKFQLSSHLANVAPLDLRIVARAMLTEWQGGIGPAVVANAVVVIGFGGREARRTPLQHYPDVVKSDVSDFADGGGC